MIVVSACDRTAVMVEPWARAGYECWCIDLQHDGDQRHGNIRMIEADMEGFTMPDDCGIFFAFPPCTDLAVSGARWWAGKGLRSLANGIRLVARCAELAASVEVPWMLENPVGLLSTHWRKPDAIFDPCDYGGYVDPVEDFYTKKTCLWTGNGFILPPPRPVFALEGSRMHKMSPSEERANMRSITPRGFAQAVFEANRHQVKP